MRTVKHRQGRKPTTEWGVVETRSSGYGYGTSVWLAHWMDLDEDGNLSVSIDPDRAATITRVTWRRARFALAPPARILVLDEETAGRVRRAVPGGVPVVVAPDDRRLREMAARCRDGDDEDVDLVPFPRPRASC